MEQKIKLIFFDLDGTLVDGMEFVYEHLWERFNVDKQKTRDLLKRYINKEISYEEWVKNDVELLQQAGATRQAIMESILALHPMEGAFDTIRTLREHSYKAFIVSGGISVVIDAVFGEQANELFEEIYINHYLFDESGKLIGVKPNIYTMENKAQCIKDTAAKYKVDLADCAFVGNNEGDVEAALCAGTSVAFNSKSDRLVEVATHHVESKNLRDILQFLV